MPCQSRWALAVGTCMVVAALSNWTAAGAACPREPVVATPNPPEQTKTKPKARHSRASLKTILGQGEAPAEPHVCPASARREPRPPALEQRPEGRRPDTLKSRDPAVPQHLEARKLLPDEQALREILELRREQGDLFRGTLFESLASPAADGEFLEALRAAATKRDAAVRRASATTAASGKLSPGELTPGEPHTGSDSELVQTLRLAARQLDGKAADLEEAQQYSEADQLRALAGDVRQQARRLAPSPLAPLRDVE